MSGKYKTKADAKVARKQIIAKGIEGAFVVKYKNGELNAFSNLQLKKEESVSQVTIENNQKVDSITTRSNINKSFTDISTIKENFYTVQIGVYRNYVTAEQLLNLTPIYYEVLEDGTNRYLSGIYKTKSEAKVARKQVIAKGVKGAFVVKYNNEDTYTVSTRSNINKSFTDISTIDDNLYTVQIGVYKNYVTAVQLLNLTPIYYEVLADGTNRYLSGKYDKKSDAKIANKQILAKGVKGAFVVRYRNGKRTLLSNLQSKKESSNSQLNNNDNEKSDSISVRANINKSFTDISTSDGIFHTVQIGVYRNYVTAEQLKNLTPIFYEILPDGTNRYFSGRYNTITDAKITRKLIITNGFKDAHVVTYLDGMRLDSNIPLVSEGAKNKKD